MMRCSQKTLAIGFPVVLVLSLSNSSFTHLPMNSTENINMTRSPSGSPPFPGCSLLPKIQLFPVSLVSSFALHSILFLSHHCWNVWHPHTLGSSTLCVSLCNSFCLKPPPFSCFNLHLLFQKDFSDSHELTWSSTWLLSGISHYIGIICLSVCLLVQFDICKAFNRCLLKEEFIVPASSLWVSTHSYNVSTVGYLSFLRGAVCSSIFKDTFRFHVLFCFCQALSMWKFPRPVAEPVPQQWQCQNLNPLSHHQGAPRLF